MVKKKVLSGKAFHAVSIRRSAVRALMIRFLQSTER